MSRTISISLRHQLGQPVAMERIRALSDQIKTKYADRVTVKWELQSEYSLDFGIEVLKQTITGSIEVERNVVVAVVQLPFMLSLLSRRVKVLLEQHIQKALQLT
ncbi:polyhydroxyalkanoic acid system family protein [Labrys portucalensis]|uniref:Polyhydroxyalkanoic acid system family protein n=1 Tax=Labrys neptuniae TaxID=376174 RepID=A0ABV6ZQU7_9HYPH